MCQDSGIPCCRKCGPENSTAGNAITDQAISFQLVGSFFSYSRSIQSISPDKGGDQSSVQIKHSHAIVIGSLWKKMSASSADAMAACLNLSLVVSVSGATCRGRCWINPPTGVPLPFQVIADVLRSRRDETVGDFPYPYSLGNTVSPHLQPQFRRYPPLRGGRVRSLRSTLLHWSYRQIAMER